MANGRIFRGYQGGRGDIYGGVYPVPTGSVARMGTLPPMLLPYAPNLPAIKRDLMQTGAMEREYEAMPSVEEIRTGRERKREQEDVQMEISKLQHIVNATNAAIKTGNKENARSLFNLAVPKDWRKDFEFDAEFDKNGQPTKIPIGGGYFAESDDPEQLKKMVEEATENPAVLQDSTWFANFPGVRITGGGKETEGSDFEKAYIEAKAKNPSLTRLQFRARWTAAGRQDRDPTPQQAMKRISDIKAAKATLGKTNLVSALLSQQFDIPQGEISEADKQDLFRQWEKEISYLSKFLPEDIRPDYVYRDGKLIPVMAP